MDQLNRPKTRGLEASEAEEDAKIVRSALQEPISKHLKKAHQKLKHDYNTSDESDEEEKLFYQQPPFDDEENEVKVGNRRRRGGGRRGGSRKKAKIVAVQDGIEEEGKRHNTISARLAAILKEELKARVVPYNGSSIEYKQQLYRIGDIVSTQKNDIKYYAQILGFHTDQYCGKYATIQWLIPRYKVGGEGQPPVTAEVFRGGVLSENPVDLNCFRFILRPPAHYFQSENPSTVTRNNFYIYHNRKHYFDSPSSSLTSVVRRYCPKSS